MRYVFLDVDGVLNNAYTINEPRHGYIKGFAAIDFCNLDYFDELMKSLYAQYGRSNVKIILSSSWRANVRKKYTQGNEDPFRALLDEFLASKDLYVYDEIPFLTDDYSRGTEIIAYLSAHVVDLEGYIVLDDICYKDYKALKVTRHLIQTSYKNRAGSAGLQRRHIPYAMAMMEQKITKLEMMKIRQIGDMISGLLSVDKTNG